MADTDFESVDMDALLVAASDDTRSPYGVLETYDPDGANDTPAPGPVPGFDGSDLEAIAGVTPNLDYNEHPDLDDMSTISMIAPIINNNRTRIAELEAILTQQGFIE
jgi:hypothetical protein